MRAVDLTAGSPRLKRGAPVRRRDPAPSASLPGEGLAGGRGGAGGARGAPRRAGGERCREGRPAGACEAAGGSGDRPAGGSGVRARLASGAGGSPGGGGY